jgi:hypothetical protein
MNAQYGQGQGVESDQMKVGATMLNNGWPDDHDRTGRGAFWCIGRYGRVA